MIEAKPAHVSSPTLQAAPRGLPLGATTKYRQYDQEINQALAGKLSQGARKRLLRERELMDQAQFVMVNGVMHHYLDLGPRDGEPLILIHGWDCSAYWWHHILEPIAAAGYRVICYDLKGHGFSESDPQQRYTVAGFSADLAGLVTALQLGPHHVAAFSLGAFVALHYANQAGDAVRSLAFFNFSQLAYHPMVSAIIPRMLDTVFNKILRPIERVKLWWIPFIYARLVMAQHTPPIGDIRLGTLGLKLCDPSAVRVSAHELARREILESLPAQMANCTQPTLLVAGANDPIMQPKGGKALIRQAPNGTYFEVQKCGHLILFELPDQVIQIMKLFLRGVN